MKIWPKTIETRYGLPSEREIFFYTAHLFSLHRLKDEDFPLTVDPTIKIIIMKFIEDKHCL